MKNFEHLLLCATAALTLVGGAAHAQTKQLMIPVRGLVVAGTAPPPPAPEPASAGLYADSSTSFGTLEPGQHATLGFSFTNQGDSPVGSVHTNLVGQAVSLSANTCGTVNAPVTLAAHASCRISVRYSPTAAGTLSGASLSVISSAVNGPHVVSLSGSAVSAVPPAFEINFNGTMESSTGVSPTIVGSGFSVNDTALVSTTSSTSGTGYLQYNVPEPLTLGTGDFTIEVRATRTATNSTRSTWLATFGDTTPVSLGFDDVSASVARASFRYKGKSYATEDLATKVNTPYTLTLTRKDGVLRFYVDGVQVSIALYNASIGDSFGPAFGYELNDPATVNGSLLFVANTTTKDVQFRGSIDYVHITKADRMNP